MVNLVNFVSRVHAYNKYIYNNIINILIYLFTVLPLLVIPQTNLRMTKITIY